MDNENRYYVYVYLDPRKKGEYTYGDYKFEYEPFYIGKGTGNRWKQHLAKSESSNDFKIRKIKKIRSLDLEPIVEKVEDLMCEDDSYQLEIDMINTIGKHVTGNGPLVNLVDGGGVYSGLSHNLNGQWKDLDKRGILDMYYNRKSIEDIADKYNTSIPAIRRRLKFWDVEKLSDINIGLSKHGTSTRRQMSEMMKRRHIEGKCDYVQKYKYKFISPNGEMYEFEDLKSFCGNHGLNYGSVRTIFPKGKPKVYKEWKLERELIQKIDRRLGCRIL